MLRSSHDACGCSTQTTSTINLKRSTLHPHEGQADRPNTPSDSVNLGSNPGPSATNPPDIASYFCFRQLLEYRRNFRRLCRAGEIMAAHFKIMEEVDQAKSNQNMPRHLRSVSQEGCWLAALSRVTTVPECRGSQRGEVRM